MKFKNMNKLEEDSSISESEERPASSIVDEVINEYLEKIKSLADENEVRQEINTSLNNKNESSTKVKKTKGKRTAYTFFIQHCREEANCLLRIPHYTYAELVRNWTLKWKMMSFDDKKDFLELERLDSIRYDRELAAIQEYKQLDEKTQLNTDKENKTEILKAEGMKITSHQSTKNTSHQTTKTASHQSTKCASLQTTKTASHQSTKTASLQSIKTASHQCTKTASHQSTKCASLQTTKTASYQSTKTASHQSTKTASHQSTKTASHQSTKTASHQSTKTASHQSTKTVSHQSNLDEQMEEMREMDLIYKKAKDLFVQKAMIKAQDHMKHHKPKQHYEKKWETLDEENKFKWIKKAKKDMCCRKSRKIESLSGCCVQDLSTDSRSTQIPFNVGTCEVKQAYSLTGKTSDFTNTSANYESLTQFSNDRNKPNSKSTPDEHITGHRTLERNATCVQEVQTQADSTSGKWKVCAISNSGDCPINKINEESMLLSVESSIKVTPTKMYETLVDVQSPIKGTLTQMSEILVDVESPIQVTPTKMSEILVDVESPIKVTPTKMSEILVDADLKLKCSKTSDERKMSITFSKMPSLEQNVTGDKPQVVDIETYPIGPKGDYLDSKTTVGVQYTESSQKRKLESPYRDSLCKRAKIDKVPFKQKNTKEKKTQLTLSNSLQLLGSPRRKNTQFGSTNGGTNQNVSLYIKQEPDVIALDKEYNQENTQNKKDMAIYKAWSIGHKLCGDQVMLQDDPGIKKSPLKDVSYINNEDPVFFGRY